MARRSYNQACGIARFLDVLGERWTLLVMREVLYGAEPGPKRFGELLERLPGISRNLLTLRLRHLEAAGLIAQRRDAGARRVAGWEATDKGRTLGQVLRTVGEWGLRNTEGPE